MIDVIRNITLRHTGSFVKALFYTSLCELASFSGIFFSVWLLVLLLRPLLGQDAVPAWMLWLSCILCIVYMALCYVVAVPSYKTNYIKTYSHSASGRIKLLRHLRNLSIGFLMGLNPAKVSQSVMKDFTNLENASSHILPQLFSSLLVSVVVFLGLFCYNHSLALCFFSCIPLALVVLGLVRLVGKKLSSRQMEASLEASSRLAEYINGMEVIKTNNMAGAKSARLRDGFDNLRKESIRLEVTLMPLALTVMSCAGSGIGFMVLYGQMQLISGELSLTEFLVLMIIASRSIAPFMAFSLNFMVLQYFAESGAAILKFMDIPIHQGKSRTLPNGSDISLKNVAFAYSDNEPPVIRNVSLDIPSGTSVAIVGSSGSGKSTLMKLIARFYDPSEGQVLIGDLKHAMLDTKDICPEVLMKKFAMVFQDSFLFKGTAASNMALGSQSTQTANYQKIKETFDLCGVDFAEPDTFIAEGGRNLSGGERQRLCAARCLLKKADILLLDEITSSLDVYNESRMQQTLSLLAKDKTLVVIAHKLKTIMDFQKIVVMDNGVIAEHGSHQDLLAMDGIYAKMWKLQNNNF